MAFEVRVLQVHSIYWAANQYPIEYNNAVCFDSSHLKTKKAWRPFNLNAYERPDFEQ
jgi:hypothetical protein